MKVIVVHAPSARLSHDGLGTEKSLRALAASTRPLQEQCLDDIAHENPFDAGLRIFDERLDEQPLAFHVEA
jgi:hypothetical protein